jgi:hypothetical protein
LEKMTHDNQPLSATLTRQRCFETRKVEQRKRKKEQAP